MLYKCNDHFLINYDGNNFGDLLLKIYYNENLPKILSKSYNVQFCSRKRLKVKQEKETIFNNFFDKKRLINSFSKIIKCKNIIFIGGLFQDISSKRSFILYLLILLLSLSLEKKVYFLSSSFELKSKLCQKIFLLLLSFGIKRDLIPIIELRDKRSFDLIKKIKHEMDKKIKLKRDPWDFNLRRKLKLSSYTDLNLIKIDKEKTIYFFISLNASYLSEAKFKDLILLLNKLNAKKIRLVFLISDIIDFKIIYKIINLFNKQVHIIKLNPYNFSPFIKLLKITDLKILYTERLHPFLVFGKYFDLVIFDDGKVKNYLKTWYKIKYKRG